MIDVYSTLHTKARLTPRVRAGRDVWAHGRPSDGRLSWSLLRSESRRLWVALHPGLAREHRERVKAARIAAQGVYVTASAYGPGLYGNTMACGGTLHAGSMVIAHRTLPCGTRVLVNGIAATVQDRGPFIAGRTIDVGPGVWAAMGHSTSSFGVRSVRLAVL